MDVREMMAELETAHDRLDDAVSSMHGIDRGAERLADELREMSGGAADARYEAERAVELIEEVHSELGTLRASGELLKHGDVVVRPPQSPEEATQVFVFLHGELMPLNLRMEVTT